MVIMDSHYCNPITTGKITTGCWKAAVIEIWGMLKASFVATTVVMWETSSFHLQNVRFTISSEYWGKQITFASWSRPC